MADHAPWPRWLRIDRLLGGVAGWLKGHLFKLELASRLRAETTVTLEWIARRLGVGTRGHLAQLLQKRGRPKRSSPAQSTLDL